ncbi:MAG: hypothetical protein WCP29_11695 [Acidobacteriota bacterium]
MIHCARDGCGRRSPGLLVRYGPFGVSIDQRWYCSTTCVEMTVRDRLATLPPVEPAWVQGWLPIKLGTLLTRQVGLSRVAIDHALTVQQTSGVPLGQTLKALGLVTPEDLLKALATQAGVRYLTSVDPDIVAHQPGGLSHHTVRTLGIVPVVADRKRKELQVACTAPIPGHAVRALSRLTNWVVEPLLVSDESLPHLVNVYTSSGSALSGLRGAVCDVDTGAATIAKLARTFRRVRMQHERCDPYVWVRLEGRGSSADVLMMMAAAGR